MQKKLFLRKHDAVEGVWYPEGELASRQMKRGAVLFLFSKRRKRRDASVY